MLKGRLDGKEERRRQRNRRVIIMLVSVLVAFIVFTVPNGILHILFVAKPEKL